MKSNSQRGPLKGRFTSAHVIATLALFVALGGISWAAATAPKNSVASKSIKKNAVTNAKIKNNAVTGRKIKSNSILSSDVKNDALTGTDINESTLAAPAAAATANDSINMVKIVPSSNTGPNEATARAAATEVPLVSFGNVSFYAKCYTETTSNATHFETIARTTANGASLYGYSLSDSAYFPALMTSTPEDDRIVQDDETDGNNNVDEDYANNVSLIGPDGKGIFISVQAFARFGSPTDPPAYLPADNSCAFHVAGSMSK